MVRVRTQGVLVRKLPYRETSALLAWFTPDHGVIYLLAKGIHRPKSTFKGCFDLLDHCELGYSIPRSPDGLATMTLADPIRRWRGLRGNGARLQAAYVATDIIKQFVQPEEEAHELFDTYVTTLTELDQSDRSGFVLSWFRMRALGFLGVLPELRRCTVCGARDPVAPELDLIGGGMVCAGCRKPGGRRMLKLAPDSIHLLADMADSSDVAALLDEHPALEVAVRREIVSFLWRYTATVLQRPLVTEHALARAAGIEPQQGVRL